MVYVGFAVSRLRVAAAEASVHIADGGGLWVRAEPPLFVVNENHSLCVSS